MADEATDKEQELPRRRPGSSPKIEGAAPGPQPSAPPAPTPEQGNGGNGETSTD